MSVVKEALRIGYVVNVITSPRHLIEDIDGVEFRECLECLSVKVLVAEDIDDRYLVDYILNVRDGAFFLSLGAAWIFREDYIKDVFENRLFNLHGSRLPQNRGGGGFSWQIMMGNRFGFCLLHQVDGGIDTGAIAELEEFIYPYECRYPVHFIEYYRNKNISFISKILNDVYFGKKDFFFVEQSEYFSSYWPRISQDVGAWIDWGLPPSQIERFVCAFGDPYSGALTTINGKVVRIADVHVNYQDGVFHPYQKGIVYRKGDGWLCVALDGAGLVIESVKDEDRGVSCFSSIKVGDRFITSNEMLTNNDKRVVYTANGLKIL